MSTKSYEKNVARALQNMTTRELGRPAAYTHCLNLVRKFDLDPTRPKQAEAYAAWLFDREYP